MVLNALHSIQQIPMQDTAGQTAAVTSDRLIELARLEPDKLLDSPGSDGKWKSLKRKLIDLYIEGSHKEPFCKHVNCTSNLLGQLVRRDHLNTLIVNLYPGNEGYSLMLRGRNGCDSETIRLPYEETEFLQYIDTETLPPLLVDLFEKAQSNLFHCGCVIAEVRDHRRAINNSFDTQFVLLRPTMHTLLCDINGMTSDIASAWTTEDKLSLESRLLVETSDPLCLDPSPAVFHATSKLCYNKHKLSTHALRRCARRCSQSAINRRRKLSLCAAPKHLQLYDFIKQRNSRPPTSTSGVNLRLGTVLSVDTWKTPDVTLDTPETIDVQKYARPLMRPQLTGDSSPVVVEEYTFETERRDGRVNMSRLVIMQRLSDESYLGTLYVDRDFKDSDPKGNACRFLLGTKANVEKYVRQFREIFTEEGRRQVKITHQVPGRAPVVSYTQVCNTAALATTKSPASASTSQPASSAAQTTVAATYAQVAPHVHLAVTGNPSLSTNTRPELAGYGNSRLTAQQQQQLLRHKSMSSSHPVHLTLSESLPARGMVSTQSAAVGGGRKLVPNLQQQQHLAAVSSHMDKSSNLTELLLDVTGNPLLPTGHQIMWNAAAMQQQPMETDISSPLISPVAPPTVNMADLVAMPTNVNIQNLAQLQQRPLVQGQQRQFAAMVTTAASAFTGLHSPTSMLPSPSQQHIVSAVGQGRPLMPSNVATVQGLQQLSSAMSRRASTPTAVILPHQQMLGSGRPQLIRGPDLTASAPQAGTGPLSSPALMHQYNIQQQQMVLQPQHPHVAPPGVIQSHPQQVRQQMPGFQVQLHHGGMRVVRPLQPSSISRHMPPPRRP